MSDLMEGILEKIHQSTLKFLHPLTLEDTYRLIIKEAMSLTGVDYGSILLHQQKSLQRVYASSPILYKVKPVKQGYMNLVFHTQKAMIITLDEVIKVNPAIQKVNARSIIISPLSYLNTSIGVLTLLSSKGSSFTEKDMKLIDLFAPLASLTIQKTKIYDQAKKALEARDLFISMASHEFRNPLATINGYAQLLKSKSTRSNAAESKWIDGLSWETSRLTGLVRELLQVDRIKIGKLEYNWNRCELKKIVNRAVNDFKFTYPQSKIILKDSLREGEDVVLGDSNKLLQVIINLLDNAAKYSPQDAEIIVTLDVKRKNNILTIQDRGQGISKKDLSKVFKEFYRGKSTQDGMGIGLFLAKNIIKEHKGNIDLYSEINKGTIVKVNLPSI